MFEIVSICKGGGYKYCRTNPPHPKRNSQGLYPLHRVLMENKIGTLLEPDEVVHHIDENKSNDLIENLELKTNSSHSKYHKQKSAPTPMKITCVCGKELEVKPADYRLRIKRSKYHKLFCSRKCGTIHFHHTK